MRVLSVFFIFAFFLFTSCNPSENSNIQKIDSAFINHLIKNAPPLTPEDAIRSMVLEDGFEIKLVASEPLVQSPVAINFDEKGRIWVVEMEGYMPTAEGDGEDVPNGKIIILEDKDNDGIADERKVFLDSLLLPRALCLIDDGLLVAEPPYLWYFEIKDDSPGKKILVDSNYTEGGNVEAQSNGLYRALDNWIYSGGSNKRYRKVGNKWLTQHTHLRGQWGISQDDYGRLFYNNNSQNILGDFFPPSLGSNNTNQQRIAGFNEKIVSDVNVFPIRPTPGVNRGYQENVLDENLRLKTFTAGSGPVIYRGDLFGKEYENNAFVGEPAANLIKRNILTKNGLEISGEQAYEGKEFLASYDERFRPVTLYDGPDGALYVVDMYRGIIQHKLFLTEYLKGQIDQRSLEKPINYGRIYKVVPKKTKFTPVKFTIEYKQLVALLDNENGWVRDKAQQLIIDNNLVAAATLLKRNLKNLNKPITLIHSLWTLEGLNLLKSTDIIPLLNSNDRDIQAQALTILSSVLDKSTYKSFVPILDKLITKQDSFLNPYIAFQIHTISKFNATEGRSLLLDLVKTSPEDLYTVDAIISNVEGDEMRFQKEITSINPDTNAVINRKLKMTLVNIENNKSNANINSLRRKYPRGVSLFKTTCQPCHGEDGNGIESLAPPLNNSEWVTGDKEKLIAIVLYGLNGPVKVNNKLYDGMGEMPGIGNNKDLVDEDIAQLLSFIRNYWTNTASGISREEVIKIRNKFKGRQSSFTMDELDKL